MEDKLDLILGELRGLNHKVDVLTERVDVLTERVERLEELIPRIDGLTLIANQNSNAILEVHNDVREIRDNSNLAIKAINTKFERMKKAIS